MHPDFPFKIDLSIVRQASAAKSIVESNIFKMVPNYEIEYRSYK